MLIGQLRAFARSGFGNFFGRKLMVTDFALHFFACTGCGFDRHVLVTE
jgi:hypothetical protein